LSIFLKGADMNYRIEPLNKELAATFVEYLESVDFSNTPHWSTCFCRFYHSNCSYDQWSKRTGAENRNEAIEQINAGNMKGYLAFDQDKCIGWCNANDIKQYLRIDDELKFYTKGCNVGCIICFVIHPEYRKQGVARLLLKKAIEDFKSQSFDAVIAIPIENRNEPEKLYRGTLNMYNENNFKEIDKLDETSVMWLEL